MRTGRHLDGERLRFGAARLAGRRIASAICSPIVNAGLSDVIGSWKIIDKPIAAQLAHLGRGHAQQVLAVEEDSLRRGPAGD
jgi:hypothetical protein